MNMKEHKEWNTIHSLDVIVKVIKGNWERPHVHLKVCTH